MCANGSACGCGGGTGVPVILAIPVIAVGALVAFVAAYSAEVAAAVGVWVVVMAGVTWAFARSGRRQGRVRAATRGVVTTRPGRGVRAVTAAPKAIGAPRAVATVLPAAEGEKVVR